METAKKEPLTGTSELPLDNAPQALIDLYNMRSEISGQFIVKRDRQLLKSLLCDMRMQRAWNILRKYLKYDDDYKTLFYEGIIEALRVARRGIVNETERKAKYEEIAKRAKELADMIDIEAEPNPGIVQPHVNDLDLEANQLIPNHRLKEFGVEVSNLNGYPLHRSARIVDLLNELAVIARQRGSEAISLAQRDRGQARTVIFVRSLYEYFHHLNHQFNGYAAIGAITSIAYGIDSLAGKLAGKKVRAMIFGATGETTH